jgi:hypothetical protein
MNMPLDLPDLLANGLRGDFESLTKAQLVDFCCYADDFTVAHERMTKARLVELADAYAGYHCYREVVTRYQAEYRQLVENSEKLHDGNHKMKRKMAKLVQRKHSALTGAVVCLQPYAEATRLPVPSFYAVHTF